jgi:hypothetical protein
MLVSGRPFQNTPMFADKAVVNPIEAPFSCPLKCELLASTTNIRLSWKSLPGAKSGKGEDKCNGATTFRQLDIWQKNIFSRLGKGADLS